MKIWKIYLSGEIHSSWRDDIKKLAQEKKLPVEFFSPQDNHDNSDNCGSVILGKEENLFWNGHKASGLNSIRSKLFIKEADIVVVRFGEKYKQWNAAFEAGYAAAHDKPLISMHPPGLTHALKEVDRAALAVTETPGEVVSILEYIFTGILK